MSAMSSPDGAPIAAALHYITLATLQRARPDAPVIDLLCGQPPDLIGGYHWPHEWAWEPEATAADNLRKARLLLDVELAEPGQVLQTGCYPDQTQIAEWCKHNFRNDLPLQTLQLVEEVGEIARCIVKRHQQIRGSYEEWTTKLRQELGDAFISLANTAELSGFDLMVAAVLRWDEISRRDFRANPQGHGLPETDVA